MPTTMEAELLDRGALFSSVRAVLRHPLDCCCIDQPDWVIGDGFSGQFRMAAATLPARARSLCFDDGDMSIFYLASALLWGVTGSRVRDTHESGLAGPCSASRASPVTACLRPLAHGSGG